MPIQLAITRSGNDEFEVWAMLEGLDAANPTAVSESFVIGEGPTVIDALAHAERELERAAGEVSVLLHDARLGIPLATAITRIGR